MGVSASDLMTFYVNILPKIMQIFFDQTFTATRQVNKVTTDRAKHVQTITRNKRPLGKVIAQNSGQNALSAV